MKNKIKTVLVDTNIIVRYLLGEESEQGEITASLMDKVQNGQTKAVILEAVLIETVFVLSKFYNVPRLDITRAMQGLLRYRYIINDAKLIWIYGLDLYTQTNLHIVDCLLIANSELNDIELVTFDQELSKKNNA